MNTLQGLFQAQTDARPLAVVRILVGGAAFLRGLVSYHLFDNVLTPGIVRGRLFEWIPDMTRDVFPWYIAAWLLLSAAFALGYRTRLCGSLLFVLIAYHLAVGLTFFWSNVYFLGCVVLLLTAADAGADLSMDRRRFAGGAATVPLAGVTLIKLHVSIVYLVAAFAKINPAFLSGNVVGRDPLRFDVLNTPEILIAASLGTIAFEATAAFALWFKPLRSWLIGGGIVFHALIPGLIGMYGGLVVFSMCILSTYVLFLDRAEFARAQRGLLSLITASGLSEARVFRRFLRT